MNQGVVNKLKDKRINVRLDDNLYNTVSEVSDKFGLNKSEVVRLALTGDLVKLNHTPIARIGRETREELIENSRAIFNQLDDISRANKGIANNINQLARQSYLKDNIVIDEESLNQFSDDIETIINSVQELKDEVSQLWLRLV